MDFESFKKKLYRAQNKGAIISNLKFDFPDFEKLYKAVNRVQKELPGFRGLLNRALLGNHPFPKTYKDLSSDGKSYSEEFRQELNWEAVTALRNCDTINFFLQHQKRFEHALLAGRYEECRNIVTAIEGKIGVSYWTLENRFILEEYQFGSERNWAMRNEILDPENHIYVRALGNLFSIKAETKVPLFEYNEETLRWEKSVGISNMPEYRHLVEYFRFKSNCFLQDRYHHPSEILTLERDASIVDRYIMLKRISARLIAEPSLLAHLDTRIIERLVEEIDDVELKQVLLATGKQVVTSGEYSEIMAVIDSYTRGAYDESRTAARAVLESGHCNNVDLIEIYVKATVEGRLENVPITSEPSLANAIQSAFLDVLVKNDNTSGSILKLLKLSSVFNNSPIGVKIYAFLYRELGWRHETNYEYLAYLSSAFFNVRTWECIYSNKEAAQSFIDQFVKAYPSNESVRLYGAFHEIHAGAQLTLDGLDLPPLKKIIYNIRVLVKMEEYSTAIHMCERALAMESSPIIEYELVNTLYATHIENLDFRGALVVYINSYLRNQNLVRRCDVQKLMSAIITNKFGGLARKESLIELPIFFRLNSKELNRVKQAYEQFLSANQIAKPSELLLRTAGFERTKLVYFLKNVCTLEVMQLSKYLTSSEMVNEERIIVCQFLAENDTANIESYKQEIASATQRNIINKVIGHFDERKIYINDNKIKALLTTTNEKPGTNPKEQVLSLNKDLYERYTKLLNYVSHNEYRQANVVLFPQDSDKDAQTKLKQEVRRLLEAANAAMYETPFNIFEVFFRIIRDHFVFNNDYGLDAYLSSKIRHGTLPNHLRSVFENFKLVTSQANGVYLQNDYWKSHLALNEEKAAHIQVALATFSKKIDDVSKRLKDEWIQCRTELKNANQKALFDFSYKRKDLLPLFVDQYKANTTYDDFIDNSIAELWNRTEQCLSEIRRKIDNDLKNEFIAIVSELGEDILKKCERSEVYELIHNVNISRTEIQTKLGNIANWFRRSESTFDGYYTLQTLVDTSIQIIKNINPSYKFEVQRHGCLTTPVRGEYHQHFIDLMTNFLQNMIEHAKIDGDKLDAKISFTAVDSRLNGIFENAISNRVDSNDLGRKMSKIQENWKDIDSNVTLEKNSGFPKIKKILRTDLGRIESKFEYAVAVDKLSIALSFETNGLIHEHIDN